LGGIKTVDCQEEFTFGAHGKLMFNQGPNDSPARFQQILRILAARHAPAGLDVPHEAAALQGMDDDEEEN
jgi:hypothetical protein